MINYLVVDKTNPENTAYVGVEQIKVILALRDLSNIEVFVGVDGFPSSSQIVSKDADTTKQRFMSNILAVKKYIEFGNTLWR